MSTGFHLGYFCILIFLLYGIGTEATQCMNVDFGTKYTYYTYCAFSCCGYKYRQYCCLDGGQTVGLIAGGMAFIITGAVIWKIKKYRETKSTRTPASGDVITVVRTSTEMQKEDPSKELAQTDYDSRSGCGRI